MKTKCEYSGTLFIISRKYFSVFRGPHLPLDTPFWTRCFPLVLTEKIFSANNEQGTIKRGEKRFPEKL